MSAAFYLRHTVAAVICVAGQTAPAFAERIVAATSSKEAGSTSSVLPAAERAELNVMVDRAKVIRLPETTRTVVVGNPAIADVAIQKSGIVVVTGKSYGETNLIALDASGNMLAESTLVVQATNKAIVTVQRGLERQSYSCTPSCMPSVQLGDAATFYGSTKEQAQQHSQFSGQH